MTERVKALLAQLKARDYRKNRTDEALTLGVEDDMRVHAFRTFLENEKIVFFPGDRFGFCRYRKQTPRGDWYFDGGNVTPNYATWLREGMDGIYARMKQAAASDDGEKRAFALRALEALDAAFAYIDRVKQAADGDLAKALCVVPHAPPRTYYEALVMMKCLIYLLRANGNTHLTLGRFDQYLYPFFESDRARGVSKEALLELTEEFFIALNVDGDLYPGMQTGDNGQSLMLGGFDADGSDRYNDLSDVCMQASLELCLIDPKINLRVGKNTPDERYALGTKLTKKGLGFPQYSNDDVVIPGLIALGYAPKDAYDYAVAACWEFIVPGCAFDFPNIETLNFPKAVRAATVDALAEETDFEGLMKRVREGIREECDELCRKADLFYENHLRPKHDVFFSLFFDPCLAGCFEFSDDKMPYRNFGFHGAGLSSAADALAAVKKCVYEDKSVGAAELLAALEANFEGYEDVRAKLIACPKMGNGDFFVDGIGYALMDAFCKALEGKKNVRGGIIRPGTGSAMEYVLSARQVGATADGRLRGEPYGCSFSPAIGAKVAGPLSVIRSFTGFDMKRAVNGGPLTLELHDTVFKNADGEAKAASLVKCFIALGGHQLQLNAVNRGVLLDALAHPEEHKGLIVRVWGWSGYFHELDRAYQEHIIARTEFVFD